MKLSDEGARLIAGYEGFSSKPYWDRYGGVWTIGYGSTKGVTANTPPVTKEQAFARLKREVTEVYGAAVDRLKLPLNQNQYDALCSFAYNLGPGIFGTNYTIGRRLRAKEFKEAADAILLYDKDAHGNRLEGLTRRRREERALFLKPVELPETSRILEENKIINRIKYHRKSALKAPRKSALKTRHAFWRESWKARARARILRLQTEARATKGGWGVHNRGVRYQRLRNAVLNK